MGNQKEGPGKTSHEVLGTDEGYLLVTVTDERGNASGEEGQKEEGLTEILSGIHERIDRINDGCKMCQQYMKEELDKCLKINPEDG